MERLAQKILIVDDNPVNLGVVVEHLEDEGYEVLVARGGAEAIERVRFAQPDLILLDVMMPDMNGFDVCRTLRNDAEHHDVPVIFMTALTDVADKVTAFAAGGVDYVSKPFQVEELLARVSTHLALREANKRLRERTRALEEEVVARRGAEERLSESEQRHRRLFSAAGDAILVVDCESGTVVDLNARCAELLDLTPLSARRMPLAWLPCFPNQRQSEEVLAELCAAGEMKWPEWTWTRANGEPVHVEVIGTTYEVGGKMLAQCTLRDIKARKEAEARVRYQAMHDSLTGLPNRNMLMERLQQSMNRARETGQQVGLLLLDLDHFKNINDSLGHFMGDELLEEVAKVLRTFVRECDTAARLGGDEFVLALTGLDGGSEAKAMAERIGAALQAPFNISGRQLQTGASIGISLYPGDGETAAQLLQAADTAMYQAKKSGRGNCRLFSRDLSMAAGQWHMLSNDLHGACERGEFVLHYQPQVSTETGLLTGLEALLRWNHPTEGLIAPGIFIPLLEEHGQMVEVGRWALRTACLQGANWQKGGLPPVRIAVNLSAQQFLRGNIVNTVREALQDSGLAPQWLELELTESLTLDNTEATLRLMTELKLLGVTLSLDDFGTGWSSFGYLRRFPLDRIKIDRSFVRDLASDSDTAAIVQSVIDLARQLKLDCVAEGVESKEQLGFLQQNRCPSMQGFLFGKGVPAEEVCALLSASCDEGRAAQVRLSA